MKKPVSLSVTSAALLLSLLTAFGGSGLATALGTPQNPAGGSSFDQRLAQRKQEQNEQLDSQTQQHIQQQCVTEQGSLRTLQTTATTTANTRNTTYQKIDATLLITIGQLKLASQDTFTLEQDRAAYVQKITAYQTTETNYLQTLGDSLTINCQSDVVGFQALLDTARAYYAQLSKQSSDIAGYLSNSVQPILQTNVTQLQQKSNGSN